MDVRPFEVVIVAHSTRLKELPLICLLQLADISRVSVCVQRHHLLLCCFMSGFTMHLQPFLPPPSPSKCTNIWTTFHLFYLIQNFLSNSSLQILLGIICGDLKSSIPHLEDHCMEFPKW